MSISRLIDIILRKKDTDDDKIKTSRFVYIGEPIFVGEIKNMQEKYDRSKDLVILKSQFYGNTECSYFAAEIIPPKHSSFPLNTFNLDNFNSGHLDNNSIILCLNSESFVGF